MKPGDRVMTFGGNTGTVYVVSGGEALVRFERLLAPWSVVQVARLAKI